MVDFGNVRLPNTDTEGEYLGIEMDFLDMDALEKRPAGIKDEKKVEEPQKSAS